MVPSRLNHERDLLIFCSVSSVGRLIVFNYLGLPEDRRSRVFSSSFSSSS